MLIVGEFSNSSNLQVSVYTEYSKNAETYFNTFSVTIGKATMKLQKFFKIRKERILQKWHVPVYTIFKKITFEFLYNTSNKIGQLEKFSFLLAKSLHKTTDLI